MRAPAPHPDFIKLFLATAAAATALLAAAPARAEAVSFYFSGTVGVTILQSGLVQDVGLSNTDWLGRTVGGMTTEAGIAAPSQSVVGRGRYSRTEVFPYTGWMSLSVLQADGSLAMIPAAQLASPAPGTEREDAFTLLVERDPQDWLLAGQHDADPDAPPQQMFALALRAIEIAGAAPKDADDFQEFVVEPAHGGPGPRRAYDPESNEGRYGYALTVNRLALLTRQLAEPSGLALCASGLLVAAALFRRPDCD